MISLKRTLIAGLILGILTACGSSEGSAEKFVESGKALMAEGNMDKARLEFRNAIQIEPKTAEAYYQLALIDEKAQNWKGMFANLSQVEQLSPNNYEAIVKLGQINLLAGNLDVAMEKVNKVLAADDKNVMAYVLRATINMKRTNLGEALTDVEKALAIDPKNIEAISVKTLVINEQGDPVQALTILESALTTHPDELSLIMIKLSILEQQKNYFDMEQVYKGLLISQPDADWVPASLAKLYNMQNRYDDAKKVLSDFIASHPKDAQTKLLLVSLLKIKEPQQAIALLDTYIEQDKTNYDLRLSKVQLLLASQQVDLAIADLKELAKLDPEGNSGRNAQVLLAGIDFQKGDIKAASEILNTVLAAAPEDESALLLKARIDIINKDIDTAVTGLRIVLRNNPDSDQALVLLAQAYMNSGSVELADNSFRQALTVNPGNTVAALSVANSLMKSSDLNRTEEVLVNALKQDPKNESILQALAQVKILKKDWLGTETVVNSIKVNGEETALTYYLTAQIAQGRGDLDIAADAYKSALTLNPDMTRALQGLVSSYMQQEQPAKAVAYLTEFIEKHPKSGAAYALLSNVYTHSKSWDKAIATLEDGLNVEPKWMGGYSGLASVYYAQNMPDKALNVYQRGLEKNPDNVFLSLQLASAYERKDDFEKAKSIYEAVLAKDDSIEAAANNLASLLTDQFPTEANLQKALKLSERFSDATEPYYLDTYAWVNVQVGELEKARTILERVVALTPNVAVFNYHLGALYQKQGDKLAAEKYLTIAKDLAEQQKDTVTVAKVNELLATK